LIAIPGHYDNYPYPTDWQIRQAKEAKAKLRREREGRIKQLKREIQVARQRLREHDHLLAELHALERDRVKELEEESRVC
jgi:ribosomal protein S14